jgi:mono/diheme cytochrome c family protein
MEAEMTKEEHQQHTWSIRTRPSNCLLIAASALIALGCLGPAGVSADEEEGEEGEDVESIEASRDWLGGIPAAPTEDWEIGFGGRLYDNWYETLAVDEPESTHPSYPETGRQEGASTWRCKECHGWDYKGKDGAYGEGSHATGIVGIQQMVGADPQIIRGIITDDTHGYTTEMIPDQAMERLALFVTRGQHETDFYIDTASKRVRGDAASGERYFQNICAPCHGFDGKALNFSGDPDDPEYVGTVATENPWEALHKVRNGQPGQPMPALRVLPLDDLVDIQAYTQTLPAE